MILTFFTSICRLHRSSGIEYILAADRASHARSRPPLVKKIGNLSIRENLLMTSVHARKTIRTDAEGRSKKLSRVGKGMLEVYLAFRFGAKVTIFGATSVVARMKNLN